MVYAGAGVLVLGGFVLVVRVGNQFGWVLLIGGMAVFVAGLVRDDLRARR